MGAAATVNGESATWKLEDSFGSKYVVNPETFSQPYSGAKPAAPSFMAPGQIVRASSGERIYNQQAPAAHSQLPDQPGGVVGGTSPLVQVENPRCLRKASSKDDRTENGRNRDCIE